MLTFRTGVIGCKVNQIEIETITAQLREYGFTYKKKGRADLGIINTCTVTAAADKKSLQVIKKLRRQCSYIVVTGCLTELNNLDHDIDCIDLVIPQKDKTAIPFILREKFINKLTPVAASAAETGSAFQQRTRAFIKIQDGCDNYCAYCRVALARGHPFSLPPAVIFKQIEQAVENKHPEIVLSGINIGQYSYQQISFNKLVARILEAVPSTLVRISSIEPQTINKNFYELFRYSNLVKHLHIPVQSGSD
ncbi:MAG TPA: radical SAM protein, partial [Spirochaetota bacterium]|nr:radical SAM protein [Spirochaetota bacterium]